MVRGDILPLRGLETGISKAPPLAQANTPDLSLSLSPTGSKVRQSSQGRGGVNQIELDGHPTLASRSRPCQSLIPGVGRGGPALPAEEGEKDPQ